MEHNHIPKIIHYCWFGHNEKPDAIKACMDSWKKFLPDWEIIEWNESNYDVQKIAYTSDAYNLKKWAFVSDYARFDVLYQYGGVYLDVDVEFIKPLPEELLEYRGFCGMEGSGKIAPGLIWGMQKGDPLLKEIMESYQNERFSYQADGIYKTVNTRLTEIMTQMGLQSNNAFQDVQGIAVYPSEFFCAYDTDVREPNLTENTICWHHYYGSWQNPSVKTRMQNVLKKLVGVNGYRKILYFVRSIRKHDIVFHKNKRLD